MLGVGHVRYSTGNRDVDKLINAFPRSQGYVLFERFRSLMVLIKINKEMHSIEINGKDILGYIQLLGNGIVVFSPCNQEILYTNGSSRPYFEKYFYHIAYFLSKICFIDGLLPSFPYPRPKVRIACTNHNYKQDSLLQPDNALNRFYRDQITKLVTQADKAEKRGFYKDAVCFIQEAYKKSKDLQVSYDQVFTKVKCLMIRARNEFALSHLYQCIRAVRKGIMYHQPTWHLYLFCEMMNRLCDKLSFYHLEYDLMTNTIRYSHPKYFFYMDGYRLLQLRKGDSLKRKLKRKRVYRCVCCSKLTNIRKRKKCGRCWRRYGEKFIYCDRRCQKKHWLIHRNICI